MRAADVGAVLALVLAFAILVTSHLCITAGLAARQPRWRAPVAFFLAPLAPYWALRSRMYVRGTSWLVGAIVYLVARVIAR